MLVCVTTQWHISLWKLCLLAPNGAFYSFIYYLTTHHIYYMIHSLMNPFDIYNVCLWYSGPKLLVAKVESICQLKLSPFLFISSLYSIIPSLHCHDISLLPALVLSFHAWFLIHFWLLAHSQLSCLLDCSPQVIGSFASFHTVSVVFSWWDLCFISFILLVFPLYSALREWIQSYILSLLHGLWYNYNVVPSFHISCPIFPPGISLIS